jgi:hypothetical protein
VNPYGIDNDPKHLEEMKLKSIKMKKCKEILRELIFNVSLILALFYVCYSNVNPNSYNYQNYVRSTILKFNNVKSF